MARFGEFDSRKKREYDLEKSTPIGELKDAEKIEVRDFEVYFSNKYNEEFVIIELKDGALLSSWSKVIVEGFNKLLNHREELQKNPLSLEYKRVVAKESKREYDTLTEFE